MIHEEFSEAWLVALCAATPPSVEHAELLCGVNDQMDGVRFCHTLSRSGWHRIGGVVTATGDRVATSLRHWAEAESDGDMFALYEAHADSGLATTRFEGTMHYFTAPIGNRAGDFIQLEVEELVEVVDRPLFVDDAIPDDIEDLLDPVGALDARLDPQVLAPPRYVFHAITDIGRMIEAQRDDGGSDLRYLRFLREWDASSAGARHRFCEYFVLRLLPFLDRFGEHKVEATPLSVTDLEDPGEDMTKVSGAPLANFLHAYDARASYPMAWYFAMLLNKGAMVGIAQTAYLDYGRNYRYLADKDHAILDAWMRSPYSF